MSMSVCVGVRFFSGTWVRGERCFFFAFVFVVILRPVRIIDERVNSFVDIIALCVNVSCLFLSVCLSKPLCMFIRDGEYICCSCMCDEFFLSRVFSKILLHVCVRLLSV